MAKTSPDDREMRDFRREHRERKLRAIRDAAADGDPDLAGRIARSPDALEPLPGDGEDILPNEIEAFIIAYRILGRTVPQIADELAIPAWRVDRVLIRARASAKLMDVEHLLQHVALPAAVDQAIAGIKSGDKDYVLEILKGRGALSHHTKNQGAVVNGNVLNVTFELPPGVDPNNIAAGAVVGQPRVLEGETVDA